MSLRRSAAQPATRHLLLTGFAAFILIGLLQAMYGPAFPAFRSRHLLGADEVAMIVSAHFLGSFATISLAGLLIRFLGYRRMLVAAALLLAIGSAGVALAPTWGLALLAAVFVGLGYGAVDIGVNLLFARAFEARSAPALNLLNGMFGVGAILGPVLAGLFLARVGVPFLLVGAASLVLVFKFLRVADPPPPDPGDSPRLALPYARIAGFMVIYFLYVATEVGAGSWETTQLEPHLGAQRAAQLSAFFWAALTVGRFAAAPLSTRVPAAHLVLGSAVLGLAGMLLTPVVPLAPYAYAFIGFALAPFFPTGITWLQEVFPRRAEQIVPIVVASANLGPVVGSGFIGLVVARGGPDSVPFALLALALPLALVTLLLFVRTRSR